MVNIIPVFKVHVMWLQRGHIDLKSDLRTGSSHAQHLGGTYSVPSPVLAFYKEFIQEFFIHL